MGIKQQEQQVDVFDLLPDALASEIFNRVHDARSLSACAVLCKRFLDLVAQTNNVSLQITRPRPRLSNFDNKSKDGFITRFIFKPIHTFIHRMVSGKSKTCCHECHEEDMFKVIPNDFLKQFNDIRTLSVKLPGHEYESSSGALLKWKAEFGKELESCVILGATGFKKTQPELKTDDNVGDILSASLTNKQIKKRVVWTISCLIASSARHHMLKRIVSENPMIREVKIFDGSNQGRIEMKQKQVMEMRKEMEVEMNRTRIPAVRIKMWYVPELELPESGGVMRGATLAVIRPTVNKMEKDEGDDVSLAVGGFGEGFCEEAVRKLVETKRCYTLEMNSF